MLLLAGYPKLVKLVNLSPVENALGKSVNSFVQLRLLKTLFLKLATKLLEFKVTH